MVTLQTGVATPAQVVLLTFGLGGLVLACSVVLWRSFYTALDWSWSSYEQAQRHAAELRERQGELGRRLQGLVNDAIALGELDQAFQLVGRPVGIEIEA